MKKLILLLMAITFAFTSCGKGKNSKDPLIGTWTWSKSFEGDDVNTLDACDLKNKKVIKADNTYTSVTYFTETNNTCAIDEEIAGTWENMGNGTYVFTNENGTFTENITFDNDTFTIVDSSSKDVFIRN